MSTDERPRLRFIEPTALAGVMVHDLAVFRRYWLSSTFSSVVEPTIYLLAFGFGFGSLVSAVGGYRYLDFLGTGVVGTAVLFTSAFAGMFQTFVRRTFQHTYDAVLATPVDVHELVTGEALWIGLKAGVYGCAPLGVAVLFGLRPSPTVVLVPLIGFVTGLGFGLFGMWMSAIVPNIDSFNYIISGLLTPLFLVAGTFFPLDTLPPWAHTASQLNPLYHCVELVRHSVFDRLGPNDLGHVLALVFFASAMWVGAVSFLRRRLID
ncbi:ABC transporter permease [Cryptosporangium phraense]|uniref:Transport permease protein n=1 Tax=Cryptosporangium phraense TaxID=2593070 RepID=A0A545AZ38_9ACTN|nr:ABC transporter permease [Cryptosporangium phraense]TQS46564.1 ABC transporter [Cryptosporangium phraense]